MKDDLGRCLSCVPPGAGDCHGECSCACHRRLETLRDLRQDARDWWYHALLRSEGKVEEARKLERQVVRNGVRNLRNGLCYVDTRFGGTILFEKPVFHDSGSTETSHSTTHPGFARVVKRLLPQVESMSEAFKWQDKLRRAGRKAV